MPCVEQGIKIADQDSPTFPFGFPAQEANSIGREESSRTNPAELSERFFSSSLIILAPGASDPSMLIKVGLTLRKLVCW